MAQGAVKKANKAAAKTPAQHGPKRGNRVIKPKKASLISQNKIKKKVTAGLSTQTEKLLGERAGHLEMLRGGKKEKKEQQQKKR